MKAGVYNSDNCALLFLLSYFLTVVEALYTSLSTLGPCLLSFKLVMSSMVMSGSNLVFLFFQNLFSLFLN